MQTFKNWLITKLLKSDDLVAVTTDWQKEYVKLASYKAQHQDAMSLLADEFNSLLKDYFELMTTKKLYEYLISRDVKNIKLSMGKDKLVAVAVDTFRMSFSRD